MSQVTVEQTSTATNSLAADLAAANALIAERKAEKPSKPQFGEGRYSNVMREFYADAIRLIPSITEAKAEQAARVLGADLGRAMANTPVGISYGKVNKDGKVTLKEACSLKGVAITNAMSLARAINSVNDLHKVGIVTVDGLTLHGNVAAWVESL